MVDIHWVKKRYCFLASGNTPVQCVVVCCQKKIKSTFFKLIGKRVRSIEAGVAWIMWAGIDWSFEIDYSVVGRLNCRLDTAVVSVKAICVPFSRCIKLRFVTHSIACKQKSGTLAVGNQTCRNPEGDYQAYVCKNSCHGVLYMLNGGLFLINHIANIKNF